MADLEKVCVRCNRTFNVSEFYRQAASKDGLDPYHKGCRKEVTRMYSLMNRGRMAQYQREYYARNREQILARRKEQK